MNAQEFVHRWKGSTLTERSASQSHFLDLCSLVGHPTPVEMDKTGEGFTFEKGADKTTGKKGFADVWKRGYFGWEYKGKHKNLDVAYQQLLTYREALENPPVLVVSDMERILIHTNFTNTVKRVVELTYDDLLTREGLDRIVAVFNEPESFKSERTTEGVTAEAAAQFAKLSEMLREQGAAPDTAAHFLIRLLFCLFAEDVGLLPNETLKRLIDGTKGDPEKFSAQLGKLFGLMAEGGEFGFDRIPHFNGSLFDNSYVLELNRDALDIVGNVSRMDWGQIEPSIFGTLFERSLDPEKRSQLGAHYTSREDILLIVEPVLMRPLRRRWNEVRTEAEELLRQREEADTNRKKDNRQNDLRKLLLQFSEEIASTTVLDPACGSGNFLYVALRQMLDLEKEVIQFGGNAGLPAFAPSVNPRQLYGIEINPYAHELASTTISIGYIQWLRDNGFGFPPEPILQKLDGIENRDAILAYDEEGNPKEAMWPEVDVIVGNPPFLGSRKMRQELGEGYVDQLTQVYSTVVPPKADLVVYWFERSREQIASGITDSAGLIATQSIRKGASRTVLEKIQESGNIFDAHSDKSWIVNGASVRVSIVCFDPGRDEERRLNGKSVERINSDLSKNTDVNLARPLNENADLAFPGTKKYGPFDIDAVTAKRLLGIKGNPNGRPNSDVISPWKNGSDIVRRDRGMWIIDFGVDTTLAVAAEYEAPFQYVQKYVRPSRSKVRVKATRENWWLFERSRPEMRQAIARIEKYIASPVVSKHRIFVFLSSSTLPDSKVAVFAREDDYLFGVLHSTIHETWTLENCSWHGVGNDPTYIISKCFKTFPFPYPPGAEPTDSPIAQAIAEAVRELVEKRDRWLNPEGAAEAELKKRTLTNLYNERPTWLDLAHKKLDGAVFDAYGWPHDLTEDEILERLLALNLERAGKQGKG